MQLINDGLPTIRDRLEKIIESQPVKYDINGNLCPKCEKPWTHHKEYGQKGSIDLRSETQRRLGAFMSC